MMLDATRGVIKAITVRIILIVHALLCVWRTADVEGNDIYWLLGLINILLVLEGAYNVIRKKGEESKWFSLCFFLYLAAALPPLWLLELNKLNHYDDLVANTNISAIKSETLSSISGIKVPIRLEPNTWIAVLEQSLLFLLIIGRWFLPRGKLTRHQLSQLLFVYVTIASDCMELFVLFEEEQVRNHRVLTYSTLAVWTLSLLQFTIALTATKMGRGRKTRAVTDVDHDDSSIKEGLCIRIFKTELWSLTVSILLMDGPFLVLRVYCLVQYKILTYGILFFAFKNVLMISLGIYRMIILCLHSDAKKSSKHAASEVKSSNTSVNSAAFSPPGHKDHETKKGTANQIHSKDNLSYINE